MTELDVAALKALPGRAFPLGATVGDLGTHFAIVSRHATRVWLALFAHKDDQEPVIEFELDPERNRIGDVWSIFIEGLHPGALYMYRLDGPYEPQKGHRFDSNCLVLDPYAMMIVGNAQQRRAKCLVVDEEREWAPYVRPRTSKRHSIVYETHVRGFTRHDSSGVAHKGTYLGLMEKIPYLKELGVTAVELMPVQEVGEEDLHRVNPYTQEALKNYWGYAPIGFFAPAARFGSEGGVGEQLREFGQMVAALHEAGIEVIMDVVFNHTAEGDEEGPTLCYRGIDHAIYYLLDEWGRCQNFTGCGNTMNCNHPFVRDLILNCLRYWTTVVYIDGFRFDLASVLGRDGKGRILERAPVVERIAEDPILRDVKLVAEAWDVGGAYQVGSFGGDDRWGELNGMFRDEVRRFWLTGEVLKGRFALRLTGSPDLYQDDGRNPTHSVNFVASHDGFTLRDLVSYNHKHNRANGENNRDGLDVNFSWNCGHEGETDDPDVNALRLRMQKNLLASLFLSLGVPMLLGGDEFGRTQQGNNNAYCQDNEISWYDWTLLDANQDLFRFVKEMIQFRKDNPVLERSTFFTGRPSVSGGKPDVLWFGADGKPQAWDNGDPELALWINGSENAGTALYLMFNPSPEDVEFVAPDGDWYVRIATSRPSPDDIAPPGAPLVIEADEPFTVPARSVTVLSSVDF